jgi:hypothetical protein
MGRKKILVPRQGFPNQKSINLLYNTLVGLADGTNESSPKRLMFQAFSLHNFLWHSKLFIFMFVFFL